MPRLFLSLILLFGTAVLAFGYLRPSFREFQDLGRELTDLEETSAEFDILVENRDLLIDKIRGVSGTDLQRIDQAMPREPRAAQFLVLLENMALGSGLSIRSIDIAGPAPEQARYGAGSAAGPNPSPTTRGSPTPGVISGEASAAPGSIKEFSVGLNVSGSYESFKGFLRELEKNLRLTDIMEISFSSSARLDKLDFTMRLKTYYQ